MNGYAKAGDKRCEARCRWNKQCVFVSGHQGLALDARCGDLESVADALEAIARVDAARKAQS